MKILRFIFLVAILTFQSSCLYLNTKVPLDTNVSETKLGDKQGISSVYSVLWLVSWGDGSTQAAAKNGGISTINLLDSQVYMVLFGLYSRVDTIAYGN